MRKSLLSLTSNGDRDAFLDGIIVTVSLANVDSTVVNLGVGDDKDTSALVDTL